MNISQAIHHALDGDAVLFVGAGFSLGATNRIGEQFCTGAELAKRLASRSGLPQDINLDLASNAYVKKFGANKLVTLIKQEFSASKTEDYHREIANLPWRRLYTTNYDDVLERAFNLRDKVLRSVTLSDDIHKTEVTARTCIHLNGFVGKLDINNIFTEIKLTETSYVSASIDQSRWSGFFKQDLRSARAVFFVGFSLNDLDIKRILVETTGLAEKSFFIVGENPDNATSILVPDYGQMLKIDTEHFAKSIADERTKYIPVLRDLFIPLALNESTQDSYRVSEPGDSDFINLILYGDYKEGFIGSSFVLDSNFLLERNLTATILNQVENGQRLFVISSELGNGKSLFLEGFKFRALEKGFRVFEVRDKSDDLILEFQRLAELEVPILVIFERYHVWLKEIEHLITLSRGNITVLLTERSKTHDIFFPQLLSFVGDQPLEFSLDKLSDNEIDWFLETLNVRGLWGKNAGAGKDEKLNLLKMRCGREIHAILLFLFESPDIKARIEVLFADIKSRSSYLEIIIGIFVLVVIDYTPTLELLGELFGVAIINSTGFRRDDVVNQFIDFDQGKIKVKSPIISEFLLKSSLSVELVVNTLIRMRESISQKGLERLAPGIDIDMVRFSIIEKCLPSAGGRKGAIVYYEKVKNMTDARGHFFYYDYLFWLQYAVACTALTEIEKAKKYFETAYDLARRNERNTFQIDDHYARFLLVEAIERFTPEQAIENFRKALRLVEKNIRLMREVNERIVRNYSMIGRNYPDFFLKFGNEFGDLDKKVVVNHLGFIETSIRQLNPSLRNTRTIRHCENAVRGILERLNQGNVQTSSKQE